ncbi:hypothetical protein F0U44_06645 [Nocardioides humilatus]|uniref:Uncharacterized protein n=1 Tax=Nocardioides humilatus TaxID=2607660 RepID=A0A5B1LN65_9ACTN|nr:hypothetical protein [Nocardioides humilatus]KAA1421936.1 hypothetical protein F0U44_06645 [Nocardioides humilatus]
MALRAEWLGDRRARLIMFAALLGVGTASIMSRGTRWLGSWKLAIDEVGGSVFLVGPVAAALTCAVYVRLQQAQVDELLSQAARPWRGWTAPALGVWALASCAVGLLAVVTTVAARIAGATVYPQLSWVMLPALLVLGAEVALGALVGTRSQRYWVVPWVGVGTFLLFLLTRFHVIPVVFDTGPTSGELIGETFDPPWFVYQSVAAIGVATAAISASHTHLLQRSSVAWKAFLCLSATAALITLAFIRPPVDRYRPAPTEADVCYPEHPTVCMTEDGHRPLLDIVGKMVSLARPLIEAGVRLPERFVPIESTSAADPHTGILSFQDDDQLARSVDEEMAAESLATPRLCAAYSSDDPRVLPEVYFSVYNTLVLWLLVQAGDKSPPTDGSTATWWALAPEQQYAWVRTTYAALSDCRLNDLVRPQAPEARLR